MNGQMTMDRMGSRGGSTDSLEQAQQLFEDHREDEKDRVRRHILISAFANGEVHADDLADLDLSSLNVIGAQFNALARKGLLEKLNMRGDLEHRKATAKSSHGRASYVWRLTAAGIAEARTLL